MVYGELPMIESPSINFLPLEIMLSSLVFMCIALYLYLTIEPSNKQLTLLTAGFAVIFIFGFVLALSDPSMEEYKNAVNAEIENLKCEQMQEHYDFYDESEFKEKIKSKYIFDCVAEKTDIDWLK